MRQSSKFSQKRSFFLLLSGLILGTVFTFGMQYWYQPITINDAQPVTAVFSSFEEQKKRGHAQEFAVHFENHKQLYIDGTCIDQKLSDTLRSIEPGTTVEMFVHPHSGTILDMEAKNIKILSFTDTSIKLYKETTGFLFLGIFCYGLAILGVWRLICSKSAAKKRIHSPH